MCKSTFLFLLKTEERAPDRPQTSPRQAPESGGFRLTDSELLAEHGPLPQGGAVPAAVTELVLALVDAQLGALSDGDDGVWAAVADRSLPRGQAGDLVTDDVGAQGHHWGQRPVGSARESGDSALQYRYTPLGVFS